MSDDATREELARLRAEHRQISDLLVLIQELTSRAVRSESVGDLFSRAFAILHRCVPFDVGLAVMLEQNLDLYIATREGAESFVSERLIAKIRATLEQLAVRSAQRALSDGEPVELEPMTAIERNVVHLRLKEFPGVETSSEGAEPNRYVVVHPA